MSCSDFEQQIALYVGEDLSTVERGRIEAHLKQCSTCWDLAEDLKESQAVFKSIRQDVPNETALSVLRERVLSGVNGLVSMTWFERFLFGGMRRKAALASVALVLVGSGALWLARTPHVAPVAPIPAAGNLAPLKIAPPVVAGHQPLVAPQRAPKRARRPAPAVEKPKQVAIKLLTDDPNIIIYWLVDEKGD